MEAFSAGKEGDKGDSAARVLSLLVSGCLHLPRPHVLVGMAPLLSTHLERMKMEPLKPGREGGKCRGRVYVRESERKEGVS